MKSKDPVLIPLTSMVGQLHNGKWSYQLAALGRNVVYTCKQEFDSEKDAEAAAMASLQKVSDEISMRVHGAGATHRLIQL